MTDGVARLLARHPRCWHVVEADGADSVARSGLLPAAALIGLAGVELAGNRGDFVRLELPEGRVAVLRFQQMADARLAPSLHGPFAGRPDAWRAHIDAHVFFWLSPARRDGFIRASMRGRLRSRAAPSAVPPVVIEVATEAVLQACPGRCYVSRFNTGSTVLGGRFARRDEAAFLPVAQYRSGAAAELAVRGPVPADVLVPSA